MKLFATFSDSFTFAPRDDGTDTLEWIMREKGLLPRLLKDVTGVMFTYDDYGDANETWFTFDPTPNSDAAIYLPCDTVKVMRFEKAPWETISGTSFMSELTFAESITVSNVFGKPHQSWKGADPLEDKVTEEWAIRFADGSIATIYDWKGRSNYHVGGFNRPAAWSVREAIALFENSKFKPQEVS